MNAEKPKTGIDFQKEVQEQPEAHFATRRKILHGLAGVPVLLTFSQRVGAVESFGRCVDRALNTGGNPPDPLTLYTDGSGDMWYGPTLTNCPTGGGQWMKCDAENGTQLSAACLTSFAAGGGNIDLGDPANTCSADPPDSCAPGGSASGRMRRFKTWTDAK